MGHTGWSGKRVQREAFRVPLHKGTILRLLGRLSAFRWRVPDRLNGARRSRSRPSHGGGCCPARGWSGPLVHGWETFGGFDWGHRLPL